MRLDDAALNGQSPNSLARVLRMLLPENKCQRAIQDALRSAGKAELPTNPEELVRFVKGHLAPQLTRDLAPSLVLALIDDVVATAVPPPVSLAAEEPTRCLPLPPLTREDGLTGDLRLPKPKQAVVRPTGARAPGTFAPNDPSKPRRISRAKRRPSVVLVHPDHLVRASTARALVNGRFDVNVFDAAEELPAALEGRPDVVLAIVDIQGGEAEFVLRALIDRHPLLGVVAWTDMASADAESVLTNAGVQRFRVVSRAASDAELFESVRELASVSAFDTPAT